MRLASACSPIRFVVGLGANLGAREVMLGRAVELLLREPVELLARSQLYETLPVGPAQPNFLNAAVLVRTALTPAELLETLLRVEARLGRVRRERWGPRLLDLDLLWGEGVALNTGRVSVPHPRLLERAFALLPMLEVAPAALEPASQRPYAALAAGLSRAGILRRRPWLLGAVVARVRSD